MTGEDDVERTLRAAFDARARGAVGDSSYPPAPRFATAKRGRRRTARLLAPLAAAAAVVAVVGGILAVTSSGGSGRHHVVGQPSLGAHSTARHASSAPASAITSAAPSAPVRLVHVTGFPADGAVVGVGMPIIATFNAKITDGRQFAQHTTVTVNGRPAKGAWYFEYSDPGSGHVMEAHYRLPSYWPAHAHVHVQFAIANRSAGTGMAFDGKLTSLDFTTGARNIAVVDDATHHMTVSSDGHQRFDFPVSLGAARTPTLQGVKIIMEKRPSVCMHDVNNTYYECGVKYAERLTYGGEYLHAAPWNTANIDRGVDSSNGCTNLRATDAAIVYKVLGVGDVVEYPNAKGPQMTVGAGYGDWNVSWQQWQRGGALPTH